MTPPKDVTILNRRSFWVGAASFAVTAALIAGAWAMVVADLTGSQRVSRTVGDPLPITRRLSPQPLWEAGEALLRRYPALQALIPGELRLGRLLLEEGPSLPDSLFPSQQNGPLP